MATLPDGFHELLEHLKTTRGFDFTGYKTASIDRRIARRMETVGIGSYAEYLDFLEVHPDEFPQLFNTILINVTGFFRDPDAWTALRDDALPRVLEARKDDEPIRVWVAGCASGEEAYTIAILLCEALGEAAFRERVKIYGTDVDEEALDEARQALYDAKALEAVPEDLRTRYFDRLDQRFWFRKDLRRNLVFGRNDLVQDAPISRVDLLTCRNTLMYFNAETQSRILRRFHFALQHTGVLFLGKSEMLLTRGELFRPLDLKRRIFAAVDRPPQRDRVVADVATALGPGGDVTVAAFDGGPVAQLVVDAQGTLVLVNDAGRQLLGVGAEDVGRPLRDLRVSYRPAELRTALDTVFAEGRAISAGTVTTTLAGEERALEVRAMPILDGSVVQAASVTFVDVTSTRRLEQDLEGVRSELGAAYEELQSTIEELETTNEELQSTNEELETTNEELQSTNEELETMNEELQSSNEELETTNDELRSRSLQLNEANAFMDTILTSMGIGVVIVDGDQRVRIWNAHSEELWGLRADEVRGEFLLGLDIGLPLEALRASLREVVRAGAKATETTLDAIDRRGRAFACHVTLVPLSADGATAPGAVLLARRADDDDDG